LYNDFGATGLSRIQEEAWLIRLRNC
jgi:hypothetical protein